MESFASVFLSVCMYCVRENPELSSSLRVARISLDFSRIPLVCLAWKQTEAKRVAKGKLETFGFRVLTGFAYIQSDYDFFSYNSSYDMDFISTSCIRSEKKLLQIIIIFERSRTKKFMAFFALSCSISFSLYQVHAHTLMTDIRFFLVEDHIRRWQEPNGMQELR